MFVTIVCYNITSDLDTQLPLIAGVHFHTLIYLQVSFTFTHRANHNAQCHPLPAHQRDFENATEKNSNSSDNEDFEHYSTCKPKKHMWPAIHTNNRYKKVYWCSTFALYKPTGCACLDSQPPSAFQFLWDRLCSKTAARQNLGINLTASRMLTCPDTKCFPAGRQVLTTR